MTSSSVNSIKSGVSTLALVYKRCPTIIKYLFVSTTLIICSFGFAFALSKQVVQQVDFTAPTSPLNADLNFRVEVISVDPDLRTFTTDWYATMSCSSNVTADIYMDPAYLDHSNPSFSSLPPYPPVYQYSSIAFCRDGNQVSAVFRIISTLSTSPTRAARSTIQSYPYDEYVADFRIHVLDNSTGISLPVNVTQTFGIAANFDVSLDWALEPPSQIGNRIVWTLEIHLQVKRSAGLIMFVIINGVLDWLVAIAFLLVSAATMVYHSHQIYAEMFVVPLGALFSLISVRVNLPGAPPGFGAAIDSCTILPVIIILGACSFFLLVTVLFQRVRHAGEKKKKKTRKSEAKRAFRIWGRAPVAYMRIHGYPRTKEGP